MIKQFFKLCCIFSVIRSDLLIQPCSQFMVAVQQPSSEGNTIGLVVEFLWVNVVERFQLFIFQDLCMKISNSVDTVSIMDVHMSHVYTILVIDNMDSRIFISSLNSCIQITDDRNDLWCNLLQIINRPFFQCFCKDGVIGIRAGLLYDLNRLIEVDLFLNKKTDQLRNNHRRMCIIDLDRHMLMKLSEIISLFFTLADNVLCCIGDHKILLINTEQISCLIAVIRIEEQRQVLTDIVLIKIDSVSNDCIIYRLYIKKMKFVASSFVSGYINIIQMGTKTEILERDFK